MNDLRAPQPGVVVIDDFSPYADAARASALAAGFGTWRPNRGEVGSSIYDGMCFWGDHAMMMQPLALHMGAQIVPNSMFFRVCNEATEGAYVHSDREHGEFTAVVYLSAHDEPDFGTAFYKNKRTGAVRMASFDAMAQDPAEFEKLKAEMVGGESDVWERTTFVRGSFNRAVIFEAPLFHARSPRHGLGKTAEDGRMVWVCHFMLMRGAFNG